MRQENEIKSVVVELTPRMYRILADTQKIMTSVPQMKSMKARRAKLVEFGSRAAPDLLYLLGKLGLGPGE